GRPRGGERGPHAGHPAPDRKTGDADPPGEGPARPRPPLLARRQEGAAARLGAEASLRQGAGGDRDVVSRARGLVAAVEVRRAPRLVPPAVRESLTSIEQ